MRAEVIRKALGIVLLWVGAFAGSIALECSYAAVADVVGETAWWLLHPAPFYLPIVGSWWILRRREPAARAASLAPLVRIAAWCMRVMAWAGVQRLGSCTFTLALALTDGIAQAWWVGEADLADLSRLSAGCVAAAIVAGTTIIGGAYAKRVLRGGSALAARRAAAACIAAHSFAVFALWLYPASQPPPIWVRRFGWSLAFEVSVMRGDFLEAALVQSVIAFVISCGVWWMLGAAAALESEARGLSGPIDRTARPSRPGAGDDGVGGLDVE